jgi:nitrogen fixation protein FixH
MSEASMTKSRVALWLAGDKWIPWIFVAGMLVVFAVNGALITYALRSFPGLSVDAAFQRGVHYNAIIAEAARQEALGWRLNAAFEGDKANVLVIDAFDRDGRALADLDIQVRLSRPVEAMADVPVTLRYLGAGRYVGAVELPKAGQWDVHIAATTNRSGESVQTTRRLVLP